MIKKWSFNVLKKMKLKGLLVRPSQHVHVLPQNHQILQKQKNKSRVQLTMLSMKAPRKNQNQILFLESLELLSRDRKGKRNVHINYCRNGIFNTLCYA